MPSSFRPALSFVLSIALIFIGAIAHAGERVALIIGNANYTSVSPLQNPLNDAEDMTAALRNVGFEVFVGTDATREDMLSLIERFGNAVTESEVALFYYAGHAFQVDGRNFLAPINLEPSREAQDFSESVPLDLVMEVLDTAPNLRFVFLDACRDNPLDLSTAAASEGLAQVGTDADYLISFATKPGAVAYDGDGRNGIFTGALLNHITKPGLTIDEIMNAVSEDVNSTTGGQQVPWRHSSLTQAFKFVDGPRQASDDTMLFQVAARINDTEMMSYYLERYPRGAHVSDAAEFILASRSTGGDTGDIDAESGDALWELARRTRQRELARFYLDYFPDQTHADEARRLLDILPSEEELNVGQQCERRATHPDDATANNPGVSMDKLRERAQAAILACQTAAVAFPEQPRFVALLARATIAAGQGLQAIALYRTAAEAGDQRALVSLGLLHELGRGVPKNTQLAVSYYERAAAGGSTDGMINLAVALFEGQIVDQDVERSIALFRQASALGAAKATFNLGVMAQRGLAGQIEDAFDLFLRAAREGEPRGYRAAAILSDRGFGVQQDFSRSASLMLRGIAEDRGETLAGFEQGSFNWSPRTIRAAQTRLADAGLYTGAIDGLVGPRFISALADWRKGGFDATILTQ